MTVVEISECFPNNYKPVTGEFILQHVRALSKYCKVITIVPLRFVPSKELFSLNPFNLISNIHNWLRSLIKTKSSYDKNLSIIYFRYVSLPRPYFESIDNQIVRFFFYRKVKKILSEEKPDIIYCNWIRTWTKLSHFLSKNFNIPFVIDHHETILALKELFPKSYKNLMNIFEKADKIIVHSSLNKKELIDESNFLNLKLHEVKVIYLGQNFSICDEPKQFNFKNMNFVCVSHLYEASKKIDVLINALALVKPKIDFELKIVGDGTLKEEYINLARSLSLDNKIKFLGENSQRDVNKILESSDIFILPSYPEAFGVVFLEALAKGLPVITCEGNGGGEELKLLGYPVVLVKPNSPGELANAIIDLTQDKNKMFSMSEKGKELIKNYFTWDKNAESTSYFLEETIKEFRKNKLQD